MYLTGGGCGNTELLTLKALEVLRNCEVVVYDSLVSEELLKLTKTDCERIYVGKRFGSHIMKQSEINTLLVEKAREGKNVVRLKGGDPYVFGRGGEEFLALQAAGICCEEIPGISSAIAVPAAAGIPVTHRGLSVCVTVVTGTAAEEDGQAGLKMDFDTLARLDGTLVILMGMHRLAEITAGFMAAGKSPDTPCAVIMEGTTERQRCLRTVLSRLSGEVLEQGFTSPAVIVIGAVAALELTAKQQVLCAIDEKEAAGRVLEGIDKNASGLEISVGVTGTAHFVEKMSAALKAMNAHTGNICTGMRERSAIDVWDMGFMEIRPKKSLLPDLEEQEWLVFTSPNGVRVFLDQMKKERRDLRELYGKQIAVIGPGTAAVLEEAGLYADYMPEIFDAAHLAEGLTERIRTEQQRRESDLKEFQTVGMENGHDKINCAGMEKEMPNNISAVFLRAEQGSKLLPHVFTTKGIPFREHPLYELGIQQEKRDAVIDKKPDCIIFGSAMGVGAYFEGLEQAGLCNEKSQYVCIGAMCAEELKKHTKSDFLIAEEASVEAVVKCLHKRWLHQ